MVKLPENASSHDIAPAGPASRDRSPGADLAAEADLVLARYPAEVRGEFIDLLRILSARQGEAEPEPGALGG